MSDHYDALRTALYTTLAGGTALVTELGGTAIYSQQAPEGTPTPYVVYSLQSGMPDNLNPSDLYNSVWWVRAYAATEAQAVTIAKLFDALLHKATPTVTGYAVFWAAREQDLPGVETAASGSLIFRTGGLYRIRIKKS